MPQKIERPIRWRRVLNGHYRTACGLGRVWLGGDEVWYGETTSSSPTAHSHKSVAQAAIVERIRKEAEAVSAKANQILYPKN